MRYKLLIILIVFTPFGTLYSQSGMDSVLNSIAQKNKTLIAYRHYYESRNLEYKTGLSPSDPVVEYDYLFGSPENAGNQQEFSIVQSLDFPTVYFNRSKLSDEQQKLSEVQMVNMRQEVLLEAQKTCIELIYRNILKSTLNNRLVQAQGIAENFKTMLEKGEGNMLDVNKAMLQNIEIKKQYQENLTSIEILNEKLKSLNGGESIPFTDTIYPEIIITATFETLEAEYEAADPVRKFLEQEKLIAQRQLEVSKSMWLPKLEAGYHYQGILGQKYNGIHAGISIPLWENRNTVKLSESRILVAEAEVQSHKIDHYQEIKQMYENYKTIGETLNAYEAIFKSTNNEALLRKAFTAGHISIIEYFMETTLFYTANNNYMELQHRFYLLACQLNKYKL